MQRNYLTEKENTYRYGVLQGNYVEEKYALDLEKTMVNNSYPLSETQQRFFVQKNDSNKKTEKNLNDQTLGNGQELKHLSESCKLYPLKESQQNRCKQPIDQFQFSTSYELAFKYQVKPQEFMKNDIYGDFNTTQVMNKTGKQLEERMEQTKTLQKLGREKEFEKFHKKNMDFTKSFDKTHNTIGFRM